MKQTDRTSPFPAHPRNIRLDAGMRLRDVAELTGWTTGMVSRIEHAERNPTCLTMAMFYTACGRDDLAEPLLLVLNQDAQDKVAVVADRWYDRSARLARMARNV